MVCDNELLKLLAPVACALIQPVGPGALLA
jgi:hypothetical protein